MAKTTKNRDVKKKLFLTIITIVLLLISITSTVITLKNYNRGETKTFESYFIVSEKVGVGVVPGVVFFGGIVPGGSGTTKLYFNNTNNYDVVASIRALGEIDKYFIEQRTTIGAGENKEVILTVSVPAGLDYGEYRGRIIVETKPLF